MYTNDDSRMNLNSLRNDSDYQWRILSVDMLFDEFIKLQYDINQWNTLIHNNEWLESGKENL